MCMPVLSGTVATAERKQRARCYGSDIPRGMSLRIGCCGLCCVGTATLPAAAAALGQTWLALLSFLC
jgi:hypothetical protein